MKPSPARGHCSLCRNPLASEPDPEALCERCSHALEDLASGDETLGKAALERIMLGMVEAGLLAVARVREDGRIAFTAHSVGATDSRN